MPELTLTEDAVKSVYFAGLYAGAASVRRPEGLWTPELDRSPDLDTLFTATEQAILFGAIRDILAGRVPSPFASSAGPVTT
jgi:hypothetical protein